MKSIKLNDQIIDPSNEVLPHQVEKQIENKKVNQQFFNVNQKDIIPSTQQITESLNAYIIHLDFFHYISTAIIFVAFQYLEFDVEQQIEDNEQYQYEQIHNNLQYQIIITVLAYIIIGLIKYFNIQATDIQNIKNTFIIKKSDLDKLILKQRLMKPKIRYGVEMLEETNVILPDRQKQQKEFKFNYQADISPKKIEKMGFNSIILNIKPQTLFQNKHTLESFQKRINKHKDLYNQIQKFYAFKTFFQSDQIEKKLLVVEEEQNLWFFNCVFFHVCAFLAPSILIWVVSRSIGNMQYPLVKMVSEEDIGHNANPFDVIKTREEECLSDETCSVGDVEYENRFLMSEYNHDTQ